MYGILIILPNKVWGFLKKLKSFKRYNNSVRMGFSSIKTCNFT